MMAFLALGAAAACSGPQQRAGNGESSRGAATGRPLAGPAGTIEGEVERTARQRHMRIWGQVERIRAGAHGKLPPLTTTASGGAGDPVTKIRNQTQFRLTIWFAGKCSHQVDVPPETDVTAIFCAGRYNLAAMVDDRAFLPLVREDQDFEKGVQYRLDFFVKKAPK
jgi:hypothetical protein